MGRQVNVFMSFKDESDFFKYLKNRWNASIVLGKNDICRPRHFIEGESDISGRQYTLYIWNPSVSSDIDMIYINKKYGFRIDSDSDVIEYTRPSLLSCDFTRNIYEIAQRIYMDPFYLSRDKKRILRKNEKFIKWYESVSRWLKNKSIGRIEDVYVMPNANEYLLTHGFHINTKNTNT